MVYQLAIGPDVNVQDISEWYVFNTRIQRITGEGFHATSYSDFADMHAAFETDGVDLVYANAADTSWLVRKRGFIPVAAAAGISTEMTIAVANDSPLSSVNDIGDSLTVAATDAPDVERIGRILLEPTDLSPEAIKVEHRPNPVLVAKAVINGETQVGFFPQDAFENLSKLVSRELRVLIASHIYVIHHNFLASPKIAHLVEPLWRGLEAMNTSPVDQDLNEALGAPNGWRRLESEEVEFQIDMMDALADL
ncbi:hypothetical protein HMPREF1531_00312 [Propionibacterium sp. oral taxon 192 str. F0372]|uniref:PhnD/SsuA/transferrin family substrate-binding protein n=1 Tax=Propionibacterium sp. oral taxon 192 TaxID=671222 RepID=UPI00035369FB|nr:PhnD/SsuA/transferrin family substrate-binding protein [Propionibacterium sp. oral taxon 192]EPH07255.1 hypothetical protein HMPREF1531_00312 [Propionibacterium sp. oral taxon 192 str. F0372]